MIYLPDTNVWIRLLNSTESKVKSRFCAIKTEEIKLCSIVKAELYFGAFKSSRKYENLETLEKLFENFSSLPFDDSVAKMYGEIRQELQRNGNIIGPNDLIIAATALRNNAVLVTHNTREFNRIPSLTIEDWE